MFKIGNQSLTREFYDSEKKLKKGMLIKQLIQQKQKAFLEKKALEVNTADKCRFD